MRRKLQFGGNAGVVALTPVALFPRTPACFAHSKLPLADSAPLHDVWRCVAAVAAEYALATLPAQLAREPPGGERRRALAGKCHLASSSTQNAALTMQLCTTRCCKLWRWLDSSASHQGRSEAQSMRCPSVCPDVNAGWPVTRAQKAQKAARPWRRRQASRPWPQRPEVTFWCAALHHVLLA